MVPCAYVNASVSAPGWMPRWSDKKRRQTRRRWERDELLRLEASEIMERKRADMLRAQRQQERVQQTSLLGRIVDRARRFFSRRAM